MENKKLTAPEGAALTDETLDSVAGGELRSFRLEYCPCCKDYHPTKTCGRGELNPAGTDVHVTCTKFYCGAKGIFYYRYNQKYYSTDGQVIDTVKK